VIIRILGEGQWQVHEDDVADLNELDGEVERAVGAGHQADLTAALSTLLGEVRVKGTQLPDDELHDSDLILPAADATVEDVRALLSSTGGEGLLPG
jgi:PspA-Associated protein